jgi:hypothetical protein
VGYREELLGIVQDNGRYQEDRADAEMELACSAACGFGCRKSIDDCLDRVWSAAVLGSVKAQMAICRFYEAHGKEIPADLHFSAMSSPEASSESSSSSWGSVTSAKSPEREEEPDNMEIMRDDETFDSSEGDPMEVDGGRSGLSTGDTTRCHEDSEVDESEMGSEDMEMSGHQILSADPRPSYLKEYCHLSTAMLEAVRTERISNTDWYNWHVRTFEKAHATRRVRVTIYGQEFSGLKDRQLPAFLTANWSRYQAGERTIQAHGPEGRYREYSLAHWVVACGQNQLLCTLLDLGLDVNAVDSDQLTLLDTACHYGNDKAAILLIDKGASAAITARAGCSPLHFLWMFDETVAAELCRLLIDVAGADVNSSMDEVLRIAHHFLVITGTPLHAAVAARCRHAIDLLIAQGANPNIRPTEDSLTPLELAARLHCSEIVSLLLDRGARLESSTPNGWALSQVGKFEIPLYR